MTKHRLMLSAAATALLAAPLLVPGVKADTAITSSTKTALSTSTAGNISINTGGSISIKAGSPAVTINSSNTLTNAGTISNADTDNAIGVQIDTSGGNIVSPTGLGNLGSIDLSGKGTSKIGVYVSGGNIFYGPISFVTAATQGLLTTVATTGSVLTLQGDNSAAFALAQGTTIDGDIQLAGPLSMTPTAKSLGSADSLIDIEGNVNGNFVVGTGSVLTNIGSGNRGVVILGPVGTCDAAGLASVGETCATGSTGAVIIAGAVQVAGTQTPNSKGGNPESGSVLVIGNAVYGGLLIDGPQTANGSIATGSVVGNGAISGSSINPVLLIDPGQSITSTQLIVRGPAIFGPVQSSVDSADGVNGQVGGYSFINHGTIAATPLDLDVSSNAVVIQGSSATNYTCFGATAASLAAGSCVTSVPSTTPTSTTTTTTSPSGVTTTTTITQTGVATVTGGLLNTGTIQANAYTKENTTSNVTATAMTIGAYATIPRIVTAGEFTSGSSTTPGTIAAQVSGSGGGNAYALVISNLAVVPEVDVLAHGSISATIQTSTVAPTSDFANASTPFGQFAAAIIDQSGSLTTINNAGTIAALTTVLTPGAGAVTSSTTHAIDLLANTTGGTTINNSGIIQGDIYFGSAGNGNTLNVGNIGTGGIANTATNVTNTPYAYASVSGRIDNLISGAAPTTEVNIISFGSGSGQTLHVGGFGYVNSIILAQPGALNVTVDPNGILFVANNTTSGSLFSNNFNIAGGTLGLNITQGISTTTPVVQANTAEIAANAHIGLQFGGFISSGTTLASVTHPTAQVITLISANSLTVSPTTLASDNAALGSVIPFLFESPGTVEAGSTAPQPLSLGTSGTSQTLLLTLIPRSPGAKNADGTAGLGLSGDAYQMFPNTAAALDNDPTLGAAIATNLSVYNGNGSTTLNIPASQQKAQQVFSQFTPDVSGGTRQVAIMLTDQATGPVASRQRLLNSYANQSGELTLWGEEYVGNINNKGRTDADGTLVAYKDHGWGFVLGMDAGSARNGWYGGALTYYSGDVSETAPRNSITHEQWYMLTGYTDWRGKHVYFDTSLNLAYASLDGNRTLDIGNQARDAQGKRAGLSGSAGATGGVDFNFGGLHVLPHISLDGLTMREEGYTEAGGGDGLDLQVDPYYANSLRAFVGSDVKGDMSLFGLTLTPEGRLGYRYDVVNTPVKLKAGFVSTGGTGLASNVLTFVGPDPDTGTAVVGGSLRAGTDTWSLGINYDWLRGNNASTTQVGTITLLGRI